ncbi:ArsA family ATPase [Streptacidiphilus sp. PB12-B1b]|uniref:ArsA family ATPase n=1 Tax=Streptacidiphilus sp. PB12-B1b TaxID=2705012 RepID=UPI0015FD2DB9|nr:ArsA-related P-loop ATPase [Streptacidiphilus sp. PB12-B1b]QMU75875.1 ArsA family ATPase [Streptacidiphilus sp. PB12-B1b]
MAAAGPSTVLVTGGGGSGRSTLAAATARLAAESGLRTLLLAADDPHRTLDRLLGAELRPEPAELCPGLFAARLDQQAAFRDAAERLLGRAKPLFDLLGVEPLDRDEISALPGAAHLALLDALRTRSAWDAVVVDAPPVAELLAALALPKQLDRYLARLLPDEQRQAARALRPMLAAFAGVPMPADWLFEARAWAAAELAAIRTVVDAPGTTVRLVVDAAAGPQAAAALRSARAGLALHGARVESVTVNRLLPDGEDPFLASLHQAQQRQLAALEREWDVPVHPVAHLGREPQGWADLAALAAPDALRLAPASGQPVAGPAGWPVEDLLGTEERVLVWRIPLPGAERGELDLVRRGDEMLLAVGPYRRTLLLPSALRRCTVAGAALRDGELGVRFAPDPRLWPR